MLSSKAKRRGVFCSSTGLAVAVFAVGFMFSDAPIASAGPFSWLAGKNQQKQQAPAPGGGPGTLPFFSGRGGATRNQPDITAAPRASDLPVNDPETYMITNPPLGTPTLSSRNIDATKAAIQRYQSIVAQGGWPMVPAKAMHPGQRGQEVAALQRRLGVSGDLVGVSVPGEYDAATVQAVKNFQARHELPATGVIDSKAMVEALNVPASIRLAQLQASLGRLQSSGAKGWRALRRGQCSLGTG